MRYGGAGVAADDEPRILKKGCKGDDVLQLQSDLNKIANAGLVVDGDFGKLTDAAVRAFQKAHKLVVDGQVGKLTRAAIVADLGAHTLAAAGVSKKTVNVRTALNVRSAPGISNNIIGVLYGGDVVECLSNSGGWTKIKYKNGEAFVSSQYLA